MWVRRTSSPSFWKVCGGWNIADMTRPVLLSDRAGHGLELRRAPGKLRNLEEVIRQHPLQGTYGIGHTRWATHGRPTEENAHPHRDCTGRIVVVHNGIVENYLELKRELAEEGHTFVTETDTEVIAHLIEQELRSAESSGKTMLLEEAVRRAARRLTGAYAISVISADAPDTIVTARNGPPAVIGVGEGESFVASDVPGILHHTRMMYFLADGDVAILTPQGVKFTNLEGDPVERKVEKILWDPIQAEKGGYKHFMLKEIFEQPRAVRDTTLGRISLETGEVFLGEMKITDDHFRAATQVNIAACGTSWHSALAGKYMIERLARDSGGGGLRQRIPLSRSDCRSARAGHADYAVRRDRGYAGGAAGDDRQGIDDHRHLQRGGLDGGAGSAWHDLYPCRTGDRGGFDQGIHRAIDGAVSVCAAPGAEARDDSRAPKARRWWTS